MIFNPLICLLLFLTWACQFEGSGNKSPQISNIDSEIKLNSAQAIKQSNTGSNKFFGYYKIKGINDLKAMQDHASVVHLLTADPSTISFAELNAFENERTMNASFKVIVEWGGLTLLHRGQEGCNYNKCFRYDERRFTDNLNGVIDTIVKPHGHKVLAFYICDEPETNPPTIEALNRAIVEIRKRPETSNIPLWINFDNVLPQFTGTSFVLPNGLDWASLTPAFGQACSPSSCDSARYSLLLDAIAARNASSTRKISIVAIGDAWSRSSDLNSSGGLSDTGVNHLGKIDYLYDYVASEAGRRGITLNGMLAFAWSECCGGYSLENSHPSIKDKWRAKGKSITGLLVAMPLHQTIPVPQ